MVVHPSISVITVSHCPARDVRSTERNLLHVPHHRLSTYNIYLRLYGTIALSGLGSWMMRYVNRHKITNNIDNMTRKKRTTTQTKMNDWLRVTVSVNWSSCSDRTASSRAWQSISCMSAARFEAACRAMRAAGVVFCQIFCFFASKRS